jgi:cholesterol transport system auxiliary component
MNATMNGRLNGAILAVGACLAIALLLSGCTGTLLPRPPQPPAQFTLDIGAPAGPHRTTVGSATANANATAPMLTVDVPRAAAGYDGKRMVYLRRPGQLEVFAFHEWVATPAQMLAPLLVGALQDGGAFRVVLASPTAATGGWRLETELLRLHQDFTVRPSRLRLTLRAVLLDGVAQRVLASREFDLAIDSAGDDPVAGAAAAQVAARSVGVAVAAFCGEQVREQVPVTRP